MTLVIVAVAITAMCELLAAGTTANISGNELTTAVNQANTIHEITVGLAPGRTPGTETGRWHDVWDLNGQTFSPPLDGACRPITTCGNWEQRVTVKPVDGSNLTSPVPGDGRTPTARLTVEIWHEGHLVHTASWLVAAAETQ